MNLKTLSDKTLHFLAGAAVALVAMLLTGSPIVASVAAVAAGAGKEAYDWRRGGVVDAEDFVATVMGGVLIVAGWAVLTG